MKKGTLGIYLIAYIFNIVVSLCQKCSRSSFGCRCFNTMQLNFCLFLQSDPCYVVRFECEKQIKIPFVETKVALSSHRGLAGV